MMARGNTKQTKKDVEGEGLATLVGAEAEDIQKPQRGREKDSQPYTERLQSLYQKRRRRGRNSRQYRKESQTLYEKSQRTVAEGQATIQGAEAQAIQKKRE